LRTSTPRTITSKGYFCFYCWRRRRRRQPYFPFFPFSAGASGSPNIVCCTPPQPRAPLPLAPLPPPPPLGFLAAASGGCGSQRGFFLAAGDVPILDEFFAAHAAAAAARRGDRDVAPGARDRGVHAISQLISRVQLPSGSPTGGHPIWEDLRKRAREGQPDGITDDMVVAAGMDPAKC